MDQFIRRPSGLLVPPEPRIHRARYCDLFGGSMMVGGQLPYPVISQATTLQELVVSIACIMTAKGWGGGGGGDGAFSSPLGGAGGYATGEIPLNPGDIITYAAGGAGNNADGDVVGTSGSGLHNGGRGASSGAGATEIYVNGVLFLIAPGGGGAAYILGQSKDGGPGGGGGGEFGQSAATVGSSTGGHGAAPDHPGDGGAPVEGKPGNGGVGGAGGDAGYDNPLQRGGGGGGGRFGGGGGCVEYQKLFGNNTGGGGGSAYVAPGATAASMVQATGSTPANENDPDRVNSAGSPQKHGLVVLKFRFAA